MDRWKWKDESRSLIVPKARNCSWHVFTARILAHTRMSHALCSSIHVQNLRVACWLLATKSKKPNSTEFVRRAKQHPGLHPLNVCVCVFFFTKDTVSCTGRPHDYWSFLPSKLDEKEKRKQFLQYLERGEIFILTILHLPSHLTYFLSFFSSSSFDL